MKKTLLLLFFITSISFSAFCQSDYNANQRTTTPDGARYEILQSEITAKDTYKLDRYTGRIWAMYVDRTEKYNFWAELDVNGLPYITNPQTPRFILYSSGITVRYTFLIDSLTGQTWMAYKDSKSGIVFFSKVTEGSIYK